MCHTTKAFYSLQDKQQSPILYSRLFHAKKCVKLHVCAYLLKTDPTPWYQRLAERRLVISNGVNSMSAIAYKCQNSSRHPVSIIISHQFSSERNLTKSCNYWIAPWESGYRKVSVYSCMCVSYKVDYHIAGNFHVYIKGYSVKAII